MEGLYVKKAMRDKGISMEAIAGVLHIHRNSASSKVNGITPFTIEEGFTVKSELFPEFDLEYLFSRIKTDAFTDSTYTPTCKSPDKNAG